MSIKDKLDAIDKLKDNYLKNAEMSVEDDFNSIDGIINNGKKDNVVQNSEKIGTAVISKKALKARADKLKQNPPKKEKEHHKREEQSL